MSSKSTLLYIPGEEHWYHDCSYPGDEVVISISRSAIAEIEDDSDGLSITLKADSSLAKLLTERLRHNTVLHADEPAPVTTKAAK